jgi:hypothetical protein
LAIVSIPQAIVSLLDWRVESIFCSGKRPRVQEWNVKEQRCILTFQGFSGNTERFSLLFVIRNRKVGKVFTFQFSPLPPVLDGVCWDSFWRLVGTKIKEKWSFLTQKKKSELTKWSDYENIIDGIVSFCTVFRDEI